MKKTQLTRGENPRLMYIENKDGDIDGADARIGWVTFSKSGRSIYYRGRTLRRSPGGGVSGNFFDADSGEEFWVSGVKSRGSNQHPQERRCTVQVDDDAIEAYQRVRTGI